MDDNMDDPVKQLTITHSRPEGTILHGTDKTDQVGPILGHGWRFSRNLPDGPAWYIRQSRDRAADTIRINAAAQALRAAGFGVTVKVDEATARRSRAEIEEEAYERAEARAERHAEYAGNAEARSDAAYRARKQISDGIPFGQPILVGHYSEARHRRDIARMNRLDEKSYHEHLKAKYHDGRAAAAADYAKHRKDLPTTLRRINRLEAEQRRYLRDLEEATQPGSNINPNGVYMQRLGHRLAELDEDLTYWRALVAALEEQGAKVWGPGDFNRGDYVMGLFGVMEVLRVNAKTLTVPNGFAPAGHMVTHDGKAYRVVRKEDSRYSWTDKVPYDQVRGRIPADAPCAPLNPTNGDAS